MDEDNDQFCTSDILILLAVLAGTFSGGVDVRGILSFVDYVDHNVLSEDELVGGLHRLAGWGFITSHDGLFRASLKFAKEYERRADKGKSNNRKLDIVKALMEERRGPGMAGDHVPPAGNRPVRGVLACPERLSLEREKEVTFVLNRL